MKRKRVCLKYHKAKNNNRLCELCRAGAKIDTTKEMDYVFIEYQEMLEDKRMFYKSQISILTLFVSTCGVAISVAVSKVGDVPSPAVLFILVNLIPAVATFFSILWIDQVFRHVCLLNYFLILGKKIREFFASNDSEKIEAFGWMKRHKGHSKSLNSYRFRHGIIIVMFFAVILASMAFGILLYGSQGILNAIEPRILVIMEVTMGLVIATFILTMTLYTVIILITYSEGSK